MQLTGTYRFNAAPAAVWAVLMDTTAIAGCLPGCKELKPVGEDRYQAELVVGVAAITGSYKSTVALTEKAPPERYRLRVEASGRPGFVKGDAVILLSAVDGGTEVSVNATADVGGMIARVGQRMIEGVGRMTMDRFFACLGERLKAD